ncbi:hypothetical protein OVY29_08060 [Sphingopyxis sp. SE2]|uniref:hypothetical protein n=1 Tax=Sphingopyxis sp. SE2 TaxID=1586240 RepID=UPI0028C2445D|nr:hypothetical protein [Sphingopyxis sp. SE2]MDT7528607.1 hypothetical protein [Sphingopyxis sp. SE2]
MFVAVALPAFDAANPEPFSPYGFAKHMGSDGVERRDGAAAIIFSLSRLRRDRDRGRGEAKNPDRDLKIGIVGSMIACVAIYLYRRRRGRRGGARSPIRFANSPELLALILRELGSPPPRIISAGSAVIALPTVIPAFFLWAEPHLLHHGARRACCSRALRSFRAGTPAGRITIFTAIVAVLAGFIPLGELCRARQRRNARRLHRGASVCMSTASAACGA